MSVAVHAELAAGRWREMSLVEQLANIGSEVGRASRAKAAGNDARLAKALDRCLELFDLTLADDRWRGRRREIARAREVVCDFLIGNNRYGTSAESLDRYFLPFAIAARRHAPRTERLELFSARQRTDGSPRRHNERLYDFLNRVARPWHEGVRQTLEQWLGAAPSGFARRIAAEFKSGRDRQSLAAFWELYLYTLWKRLNVAIEIAPQVDGSTSFADFLIANAESRTMVEATVSFDEVMDSPGSRRLGQAYQVLDQTESPNFFLSIKIRQGNGPMPSLVGVRRRLEAWLATLDPDAVAAAIDAVGMHDRLPELNVSTGSWQLVFEAIPKSPEARGQPGIRPLGVFDTGGARVLNTIPRIRDALIAKADQTRGATVPVLIALNAHDVFVDDDDIYAALFGNEAVQFRVRPDGDVESQAVRKPTGLWTEGRVGRRSHIAAVLTVLNVSPWSIDRGEPTVWLNPWAKRSLGIDLPFRRFDIDHRTGLRVESPARARIGEIFGLGEEWPAPRGPWDD